MNIFIVGITALAVAGCSYKGNLRSATDYGRAPKAPRVDRPHFDPYAAPGEVSAVWRPTVLDRRGTVIAPGFRAEGRAFSRPAGTF